MIEPYKIAVPTIILFGVVAIVFLIALPVHAIVISNQPIGHDHYLVGLEEDYFVMHIRYYNSCINYTIGEEITYGAWQLIPVPPLGC